MKKVAVTGAGAMGSGIAQIAAMAGHEVFVYDSFPGAVNKSRDNILQSLNKLAGKNQISDQEAKAIFGRIYFLENIDGISSADLVIEAIVENETEKKRLFKLIESIVAEHAVIATNTSSLSVTALANSISIPERFIGIHFFNPPVLMRLVEVIPALQTSQHIIDQVIVLINSWGKETVVAKDTPGFIVNRIARPFYSEALRIVDEQLSTPQLVDQAMKKRGGFKMGPFELMDFIGNDINAAVTHAVWTAMHYEPRYKPSLTQESLVKAGWLGRKTGKGFYEYASDNSAMMLKDSASPLHVQLSGEEIFDRIIVMLINEAADAWYYGIASREDIDRAMTLGVNYPKGLLAWADEIGIEQCVAQMDELFDLYKDARYRCSPGLKTMHNTKMKFYA